jgi:hypothetical protein
VRPLRAEDDEKGEKGEEGEKGGGEGKRPNHGESGRSANCGLFWRETQIFPPKTMTLAWVTV